MGAVEISSVRKSYNGTVALADISLSVSKGSFFTLLGPSGCGKTTLLRMIAGFHEQDSGSISIDGEPVDHLPPSKRNIGMVFQDYAVFPHLNVFENVAFGLRQRGLARDHIDGRVNDMLTRVQLGQYAKRMPHELSGGQQQRVGMARALVISPRVLLMDEPLSNLDARLRVDLRQELRSLQQALNITTIYVTHDQEEALAMSDTVCVMHGGHVQQADSSWNIYNRPANGFVASFVGENNFLSATTGPVGLTIAGSAPSRADGGGNAFPDGKELVAAIRPEHVFVNEPAIGGSSYRINASVTQVAFTGREVSVNMRATNGEVLRSTMAPVLSILNLQPGDLVTATFAASAVQVFESGENGRRLL